MIPRLILCPIDFSETSDHALEYALDLAKKLDAKVHVAHAYQVLTYGVAEAPIVPAADYIGRLRDDLCKALEDAVRRHRDSGVEMQSTLVEGVPHAEIVRLAKQCGAGLIVMGTHGRTGIKHVLLGSVAERVVRHSECPVLTVRKPESK